MECWNVGAQNFCIISLFQYSSIPTSTSVSYILCEPFKRQGMAEPPGFCEIVGRPADGGELKSLRSLVVEKRNLLIVSPAHPASSHNIGHGANIGIVDVVMRSNRNLLFFLGASRNISEHPIAAGCHSGNVSFRKQGRSPEACSYVRALQHIRTGLVITHVVDVHAGLEPGGLDHGYQRIGGQ